MRRKWQNVFRKCFYDQDNAAEALFIGVSAVLCCGACQTFGMRNAMKGRLCTFQKPTTFALRLFIHLNKK